MENSDIIYIILKVFDSLAMIMVQPGLIIYNSSQNQRIIAFRKPPTVIVI